MEEVGKILPAVFKRQVGRNDPKVVEILTPLWARVVGKGIALQSRPAAFEAGTLTLVTSCPTWAAQLRQMAEAVCAQVNNCLGGAIVKKLKVRVIPEADRADLPAAEVRAALGGEPQQIPLPDGAMQLESEMRGALERSYAKYFARKKGKVQ
ncbi:MAG: DUF721 domain-containing protein [Terriglobia bacterium]